MRDDAPSSSLPQGTGSRVGQMAMIAGGAALVALAARRRSWRTLGAAVAGAPLIYRGATGRWPVPRALAQRASDAVAPAPVEATVTIERPRAELYAFWRRLENLPRFMRHLEEVVDIGGGRSHWVARSPLGFRVEWDAEIVEERQDQLLSWWSLPNSQVQSAGMVLFEDAPAGRGTVVRVSMELLAPGSGLGHAVGKLLAPITEQQVREDLRRFKQLMEAGEIPTTEGQPTGARSAIHPRNPL